MMMEAGTPIDEGMRLSLRATGNAAFAGESPKVERLVKEGEDVVNALRETALFPNEFLMIVETAELSGTLPEVLRKQAEVYYDTAARRMKVLTWIASGLTWLMVAALIIFLIFSLFMQIFGVYNQTMKDLGI
jgi:type IV pilus assembly protein PilC